MNPMYLVLALVASAAAAGSMVMLIVNVSGACTAMLNLLCVLAFVVTSVFAAHAWVKGLNIKIKPHIKFSSI